MVLVVILFPCYAFSQLVEKRELREYDKIEVFGNFDVELFKGTIDELEVILETDQIEFSQVKTEVVEKTLKIKMSTDLFSPSSNVKIKVPFQQIREITSRGGSDVICRGMMKGDKIEFHAISGGDIYLEVELNTLDARVGQGSLIVLEGKTGSQEIKVSSGGTYSAFKLDSEKTYVKAVTGGKAKVQAAELLSANVSTKGYIGYKGNPDKKKINTRLGGIVELSKEEVE